jgi:hypothetical protein
MAESVEAKWAEVDRITAWRDGLAGAQADRWDSHYSDAIERGEPEAAAFRIADSWTEADIEDGLEA